jgi:hypothetical protein
VVTPVTAVTDRSPARVVVAFISTACRGGSATRRATGHRERAPLVRFKGDLLRQHDIASDEVALRNEAPFADTLPRVAQFLDIGLSAVVYPVARAGIAADDVEIPGALVARELLGREPFLQQRQRPPSATNKTRIKQRFLRRRIEGADNPLLAGP